jgi:sulfoquinovosidase
VGRNKGTRITRLADADDGAGGDYYWTFFPQTSFVSSGGYWCHLDTSAYADFDFRADDRHDLYSWAIPERLVIGEADAMRDLVSDLSAYFGRQGELPDWCYDGAILGVQGGTAVCRDKLAAAEKAGVKVAGLWAQDWEGINVTSFGQRLRWNWIWDAERYPGLDREIAALKSRGVRFLGYINPYVGANMSLFNEAKAKGYLAKDSLGQDYLVEFGEFYAGIVDLTSPAAFDWYKSVIKKNLIAFGLSGWMADFGEYLPTDAVLHSGKSAELAHNEWPSLWARCNREAVDEAEAEGLVPAGEVIYFMRAGGVGSQSNCPLMWAGDQNVDWSEDDGLPSVIPAALSLGLSGHGLHHSDLGGYTTLYGMRRTKELFMRWAEFSALTVIMRSHEGNRPKENWQFDSDAQTLAHLARMTAFHAALKPYLKAAVAENAQAGIPVMRPLFLHFEEDEAAWTIKDEYLLGPDLLVAPVIVEGASSRSVHLPRGSWKHLWSGRVYSGGDMEIAAPLGEPPVFARTDSKWMDVFEKAANTDLGAGERPQKKGADQKATTENTEQYHGTEKGKE